MCANKFGRRVLDRPSLLILWAGTWARLFNKTHTVAKKLMGPGVQWVKLRPNFDVWQLQEVVLTSTLRPRAQVLLIQASSANFAECACGVRGPRGGPAGDSTLRWEVAAVLLLGRQLVI